VRYDLTSETGAIYASAAATRRPVRDGFPDQVRPRLRRSRGPGKRIDEVHQAKAFIAETRAAELAKAAAELKTMGVDWSDRRLTSSRRATGADAEHRREAGDRSDQQRGHGRRGDAAQGHRHEQGTQTLYASTDEQERRPMFDNKELILGKIEPGKSRTATAPSATARSRAPHRSTRRSPRTRRASARSRRKRSRAQTGSRSTSTKRAARTGRRRDSRTIRALERPTFAFTYDIEDNRGGANVTACAARRG